MDRVGSAKFVSKFDLLKGYWQVPLTARARELSAFVTLDDFLQNRFIMFGKVLSGLSGCEACLDNVV